MPCYEARTQKKCDCSYAVDYARIMTAFLCAACKHLTVEQLKQIDYTTMSNSETLLKWYLDHLMIDLRGNGATEELKKEYNRVCQ